VPCPGRHHHHVVVADLTLERQIVSRRAHLHPAPPGLDPQELVVVGCTSSPMPSPGRIDITVS
jgi:hypothetical protein